MSNIEPCCNRPLLNVGLNRQTVWLTTFVLGVVAVSVGALHFSMPLHKKAFFVLSGTLAMCVAINFLCPLSREKHPMTLSSKPSPSASPFSKPGEEMPKAAVIPLDFDGILAKFEEGPKRFKFPVSHPIPLDKVRKFCEKHSLAYQIEIDHLAFYRKD